MILKLDSFLNSKINFNSTVGVFQSVGGLGWEAKGSNPIVDKTWKMLW